MSLELFDKLVNENYNNNNNLTNVKFYLIDQIFKKNDSQGIIFKFNIIKFFKSIDYHKLDLWIKYKIIYGFNKLSYFDIAMWLYFNKFDKLYCIKIIRNEYDYVSLLYHNFPELTLYLEILKD